MSQPTLTISGCDQADAVIPLVGTPPVEPAIAAVASTDDLRIGWIPTAPYALVEGGWPGGAVHCLSSGTSARIDLWDPP